MQLTTIGYWGAYPKANEATSCYLVQENGSNVLLDCGSGALAKLQNHINLEDLDAVFISHTHTDHIADLFALEYAMLIKTQLGVRKRPLDVFIYTEDIDSLPLEYPEIMRVHQIKLEDDISIGTMHITFSDNMHEIPCCAMKITNSKNKTLVYSADTGYTKEIIEFAFQADLFIVECSFYAAQHNKVKGHLNTMDVSRIISSAQVDEVMITHLPHFGDISQLVQEIENQTHRKVKMAHESFAITI